MWNGTSSVSLKPDQFLWSCYFPDSFLELPKHWSSAVLNTICIFAWCGDADQIWLWLKASTSTFAKWEPSQMKKNNEQCVDNKKSSRVFDMKFMTTWACFLSPILKPKSLGIFPPSHLIIFYLHSKWLWSQVTWQNPKWLRLLTWRYLGLLYHRYLYFVSF